MNFFRQITIFVFFCAFPSCAFGDVGDIHSALEAIRNQFSSNAVKVKGTRKYTPHYEGAKIFDSLYVVGVFNDWIFVDSLFTFPERVDPKTGKRRPVFISGNQKVFSGNNNWIALNYNLEGKKKVLTVPGIYSDPMVSVELAKMSCFEQRCLDFVFARPNGFEETIEKMISMRQDGRAFREGQTAGNSTIYTFDMNDYGVLKVRILKMGSHRLLDQIQLSKLSNHKMDPLDPIPLTEYTPYQTGVKNCQSMDVTIKFHYQLIGNSYKVNNYTYKTLFKYDTGSCLSEESFQIISEMPILSERDFQSYILIRMEGAKVYMPQDLDHLNWVYRDGRIVLEVDGSSLEQIAVEVDSNKRMWQILKFIGGMFGVVVLGVIGYRFVWKWRSNRGITA